MNLNPGLLQLNLFNTVNYHMKCSYSTTMVLNALKKIVVPREFLVRCRDPNLEGIDMLYADIKSALVGASTKLFTDKSHYDKHIAGWNHYCKEAHSRLGRCS